MQLATQLATQLRSARWSANSNSTAYPFHLDQLLLLSDDVQHVFRCHIPSLGLNDSDLDLLLGRI